MLRTMRQGSRWIMWIVILGVGAVFVLYLGIGGAFAPSALPDTVVGVGPRNFDARDVQRVRQNQEAEYRRVLGDGFDPEAAGDFLDQAAVSSLLRVALFAREAERMGLSVSNDELRAYLRQIAGAEDGGRIDEDLVTNYAEREYGSLLRFEQALRDDLLARKASRLIGESVAVSDAEVRDALRYAQEEVELAIVKFRSDAMDGVEADPGEVQRILTAESEALREAYDARRLEFDRPERVRARHILVRLDPDAEEATAAEALARVTEIRERIEGGANFADVAMEVSDDPGSQQLGGDLGFFPRGRMVKAFELAAFELEPGVLSEPVKSSHGYHLILVEERQQAENVPFETAREQLAEEMALETARKEAARTAAEALATRVSESEDGSLVSVAREEGLPIDRPDPIRRRADGYIAGLGAAQDLMDAAFALREEQPNDGRVHEARDAFVLIELVARSAPSDEEIDAALESERENLLNARRAIVDAAWVEARRKELEAEGQLTYNLDAL